MDWIVTETETTDKQLQNTAAVNNLRNIRWLRHKHSITAIHTS